MTRRERVLHKKWGVLFMVTGRLTREKSLFREKKSFEMFKVGFSTNLKIEELYNLH